MEDKFLYQLGEAPDPAFAARLHRKLEQIAQAPQQKIFTIRNVAFALVIISIAVISLASISPVRAFVQAILTDIGGQPFEVTSDYPGDNASGEEVTIYPQIMTLDEALAVFPIPMSLPSSLPQGCTLDEESVRVYVGESAGFFANTIEIGYSGNCPFWEYMVTDAMSEGEIVAPDAAEEMPLNDKYTAVLIKGGWDYDQKSWSDNDMYRLKWKVDGVTYSLTGKDPDQLVDLARSTLP